MLEALLQFVLKLMPKPIQTLWYRYESVWRYCYYGAWTTVVSYVTKLLGKWIFALFGLTMEQTIPNLVNTTISWIIAVTFAFVVNKKYVFKSETHTMEALRHEILTFYGARGVSLLLELALMWLTTVLLKWNYALMAFLVQFIILAINYVFSKLVVFRKGSTETEEAEKS